MRRLTAVLFLSLFLSAAALAEWRWAPETDFRAPDKAAHFLAGNYMAAECGQWQLAGGNKWAGYGIGTGLLVLWEVKDGFTPWEKYGRIGAEGFDWRDIIMNNTGGLFGVRLHEDIVRLFGYRPIKLRPPSEEYSPRPVKEFWQMTARRGIFLGVYVGGCATYNAITQGEAFPHRDGFYKNAYGNGFLETHNSESSLIIPWMINSVSRPYFNLFIRFSLMNVAVLGFEGLNGLMDDRDVPWLGDRNGYNNGDVWTGFVSANIVLLYDLIFYTGDIDQRTYGLGPTLDGLGYNFTMAGSFCTFTPKIFKNQMSPAYGFSLRVF